MKRKLLLLVILVLSLAMCFTACDDDSKTVSSVTVVSDSITTEYEIGATPDFSGIKAVITYSDGSVETVTADKLEIGNIDTSTAGVKKLTVSFNGVSIELDITVKEAAPEVTLTALSIVQSSISTKVEQNASFSTSGIQVEATYSDGSIKILGAADLTITNISTETAGTKTLSVSYGGLTASIDVTVVGVSSVTVAAGTLANVVKVGETLDTSKVKITVKYTDGSEEIVEAEALTFGALDTTAAGDKKLAITYKGFTYEYDVKVINVTALTLSSGFATKVKVGDVFNTADITAKATYSNQSEEAVSNSQLTFSAVDTSVAGVKTLTVSYSGVSATVEITVIGVKNITIVEGLNNKIMKGETYATSAAKASITYTDDSTEVITADKLSFAALDTATAGTKALKVTYLDKTVDFNVLVVEETGIEIKGVYATSVRVLSDYVKNGIVAHLNYSDGTYKVISNALLEISISTATAGTATLTVKYEGYTATKDVTVVGVASISLIGKIEILKGEALDDFSVKVVYTDESEETLTKAQLAEVGTLDTATAGEKEFSVKYLDKTATLSAEVFDIVSITVKGVPGKFDIGDDEARFFSGMTVWAIYGDSRASEREITSGYTTNIEDLDFTVAGDKVLTVSYVYGEETLTASVTVSDEMPDLSSIKLANNNYNKLVGIGQSYSVGDLKIIAVYANGYEQEIALSELVIGTLDTAELGDKTVSVSYTENEITKSLELNVKVLPVTNIAISGVLDKVDIGEAYSTDNIQVTVAFGEGEETITVVLAKGAAGLTVGTVDTATAGNKTLEVSYGGETATKTVHVKAIASIEIVSGSYADKVGIGQSYSTDSLKIKVTYTDNTVSEELLASELATAPSTAEAGDKVLTVSYTERGVTKTASAAVKVLPVTNIAISGVLNKVDKGAVYSTDNISVTVTFGEGEITAVLTKGAAGLTVGTIDTTTAGDKALTATYGGANGTYAVVVREVTAISIVSGMPSVVRFGYLDINRADVQIMITWSNGDTEYKKASELGAALTLNYVDSVVPVPHPVVPGLYLRNGGTRTVTVSYAGISATATIEVMTASQVHGLNGTVPGIIPVGGVIETYKTKLTVIYYDKLGNEYVYIIGNDDEHLEIVNISTATPGDQGFVFKFTENLGQDDPLDPIIASVIVTVIEIDKITLVPGTLTTNVMAGQSLSYDKLQLRVQYTNGTFIYVDMEDGIVISEGELNINTPGTYTIQISYQGVKVTDANGTEGVTVTVNAAASTDALIFGVSLPDALVARETYKLNFKDQDNAYVVGDDNKYYFYLELLVLDDNDNIVDSNGKGVRSEIEVYIIEDGTPRLLTGTELESYVAVNEYENSYDFVDGVATGKTFKLRIRPKENCVDPAACWREHTVTVVDAYNIYDAKELNLVTNHDCNLAQLMETENVLSQMVAVNNFLANNGIARPATLNGIVIHDNVDIKPTDLPPEYYFTYTNKNGEEKTEFYDQISLYRYGFDYWDTSFSMYGNYYGIYSYNLPCVVAKEANAGNTDGLSGTALFYFGSKPDLNWAPEGTYNEERIQANVIDMSFRDNDPNSNDQSASERHMRGLVCLKPSMTTLNILNSNIHAFFVSTCPETDATTMNIIDSDLYNAWQGHIFIWSNNWVNREIYKDGYPDRYPLDTYRNVKINITNSRLAKCGGPVILAQTEGTSNAYIRCGADVTVDDKSELYSYVTGQEAWFVALNQTQLAGQILAMNGLIQANLPEGVTASYNSKDKIPGVTTMNMIMVNMGGGAPMGYADYEGSLTIGGTVVLNQNDADKTAHDNATNPQLKGFLEGSNYQAPVFQSTAGQQYVPKEWGMAPFDMWNNPGTVFTYGNLDTGILDANGANPGADHPIYQGDYITLYFMGMGIALEYYH